MADQDPEGQAPPDPAAQEATPTPAGPDGESSTTDAKTASELERARREAAGYRKRASEAEAELKALRDAELSEQERLTQERDVLRQSLAQAEERYRSTVIESAVVSEAARMGVVDPAAAAVFLHGQVTLDDDGKPVGVTDALTGLLEAKPYLRAPGPAVPAMSSANPPAGAQQRSPEGQTFTREQVADRDFYRKHRDEIVKALAEGRIEE